MCACVKFPRLTVVLHILLNSGCSSPPNLISDLFIPPALLGDDVVSCVLQKHNRVKHHNTVFICGTWIVYTPYVKEIKNIVAKDVNNAFSSRRNESN